MILWMCVMVHLKKSKGSTDRDESQSSRENYNQSREIFIFHPSYSFFPPSVSPLTLRGKSIPEAQASQTLPGALRTELKTGCTLNTYCLCVCVCVLFLPDASVPVREKGSLRRGNGSFVFLLILPVDTRVADLLATYALQQGKGYSQGFPRSPGWSFTSNSKQWVQKEGCFIQSAPHPLRGWKINVVIAQQSLPFTLPTRGTLSDNFKPWGFWQTAQYKSWQKTLSAGWCRCRTDRKTYQEAAGWRKQAEVKGPYQFYSVWSSNTIWDMVLWDMVFVYILSIFNKHYRE